MICQIKRFLMLAKSIIIDEPCIIFNLDPLSSSIDHPKISFPKKLTLQNHTFQSYPYIYSHQISYNKKKHYLSTGLDLGGLLLLLVKLLPRLTSLFVLACLALLAPPTFLSSPSSTPFFLYCTGLVKRYPPLLTGDLERERLRE
jgi:hypothetical protein